MNYKLIVKISSLALLATAFGQASAMEKPQEELNKALLKAVEHGNIAQVTQLLKDGGADINCKDQYGLTPLSYVRFNENLEVAELLLKNGAHINYSNSYGETLLHFACRSKNTSLAKLLLDHGADINCEGFSNFTPLHLVCDNSNFELTKLLLDKEADINCKTNFDLTPLRIANQHHNTHIATLLINEPNRRKLQKEKRALCQQRLLNLLDNPHILASNNLSFLVSLNRDKKLTKSNEKQATDKVSQNTETPLENASHKNKNESQITVLGRPISYSTDNNKSQFNCSIC